MISLAQSVHRTQYLHTINTSRLARADAQPPSADDPMAMNWSALRMVGLSLRGHLPEVTRDLDPTALELQCTMNRPIGDIRHGAICLWDISHPCGDVYSLPSSHLSEVKAPTASLAVIETRMVQQTLQYNRDCFSLTATSNNLSIHYSSSNYSFMRMKFQTWLESRRSQEGLRRTVLVVHRQAIRL